MAARRVPPLDRALGRHRAAGLLRPARQQQRPAEDDVDGRLGRLCGLAATNHPGVGRCRGAQPSGAHRRCPRTLGLGSQLDYDDPTSNTVGAELVCSSITSGGDGADSPSNAHPWLQWNPHLRFQNNQRGYVNTTITREQLVADFRCLPRVSEAGAPAFTRASFTIVDGEPGLNQTADNPSIGARALLGQDADLTTAQTIAREARRP